MMQNESYFYIFRRKKNKHKTDQEIKSDFIWNNHPFLDLGIGYLKCTQNLTIY